MQKLVTYCGLGIFSLKEEDDKEKEDDGHMRERERRRTDNRVKV